MKLIPVDTIVIRKARQRQEFEPNAMQELINSINDTYLAHTPVTRQEAGKTVLVSGERRIKAMQEIWTLGGTFTHEGQVVPAGMVPCTDVGELTELQAEEAELDENLKRKDLTWQEHAAAMQKLHQLRVKQALAKAINDEVPSVPGSPPALPHTIADTAEEVHGRSDGYFQDSIRRELAVARNLDNPAIAKAKTVDEAYKLLKREEAANKNRELAELVGRTYSSAVHRLVHADARTFMGTLADGAVDVILTDPPYGMGADSFGDAGGKLSGIEHNYDDSLVAWRAIMDSFCPESFRVAKAQAHAYVFCDIERFAELKGRMESAGWYVFRTPFVAHKINSGRVPLPDQGPRRQYELILYAIKGKRPVNHIYSDVISCQGDDNVGHGAQKPVALYSNLLLRSVRPGDVVADFFAGSGTIFPAAQAYQCTALACEQDAGSYGLCVQRLKDLDTPDPLISLELGVAA